MPPVLKQFDEEVQRYKSMEKAMKSLPVSKCIGWTRIDAKPLKKSLEILVSKWSYLYIKYLQDKVVNEMEDLYSFLKSASKVLDLKVGDEKPAGRRRKWRTMRRKSCQKASTRPSSASERKPRSDSHTLELSCSCHMAHSM